MKPLFASIAAVAFLAAAVPAPARANDNEALTKIITGLLTVGLFAQAVENRLLDGDVEPRVSTRGTAGLQALNGTAWGTLTERGNRTHAVLPRACRRTVETSNGPRAAYGQRCLERNDDFSAALPHTCERKVRTDRGLRTFYPARCLTEAGFRVEARRGDD